MDLPENNPPQDGDSMYTDPTGDQPLADTSPDTSPNTSPNPDKHDRTHDKTVIDDNIQIKMRPEEIYGPRKLPEQEWREWQKGTEEGPEERKQKKIF